jgi:hypothetical protein
MQKTDSLILDALALGRQRVRERNADMFRKACSNPEAVERMTAYFLQHPCARPFGTLERYGDPMTWSDALWRPLDAPTAEQ